MKISIITPSFNQGEFIEDTIKSVLEQDHPDFEHLVIDGGSTDNTLDILKEYKHLKWISEKDKGQANAVNKGFKLASGDIVAWLNSDDFYDRNIFKTISNYFESNPSCKFLYGDITYIDENKKFLYKLTNNTMLFDSLLKNPNLVRQPSCFWHRDVLNIIGYLNEELNLVMDYEYLLRTGKKFKFHYIPKNFSFFRNYGSNKTNKLIKQQVYELYKVMKKENIGMDFYAYKFLLGRYIDSLNENNIIKQLLEPLRKKDKK